MIKHMVEANDNKVANEQIKILKSIGSYVSLATKIDKVDKNIRDITIKLSKGADTEDERIQLFDSYKREKEIFKRLSKKLDRLRGTISYFIIDDLDNPINYSENESFTVREVFDLVEIKNFQIPMFYISSAYRELINQGSIICYNNQEHYAYSDAN